MLRLVMLLSYVLCCQVSCIGTKLMTALAFYRQTARDLAVRYRTIQEEHQVAISTPSPEYADLERLKTELEQAKVAAKQVVAKDYTVFNDLNLVPLEELIKSRPEIFLEMHRYSTTEQHHRTFLAQIEYEHERRKRVMSEIESLTKKKRVLQDDVSLSDSDAFVSLHTWMHHTDHRL